MEFLTDLWLPIVLSAVAVWIGSAMAWMLLPHHKGDFRQLPDEDGMMASVRKLSIPPGVYFFPHMKDCGKMKNDPIAKAKFEQGPHGLLQVWPPDAFGKMGRNMVLSFIFYLIVGVFVAYLATLAIPTAGGAAASIPGVGAAGGGADFMTVFRFTGAAAVMAYCFAQIPHQIWFGTPLRTTLAYLADGIAFGLITGAIFAWLWPGV